jgi:hypothetical protein
VDDAGLRRAYEELARRAVADRLAFADRVQEVLDHAQAVQVELDERKAEVGAVRRELDAVRADAEALRGRVDELHRQFVEAHDAHRAVVESRSFRYTRPFRRLGRALGRR